MTVKAMLESYEAEIILLVAIVIGVLIAIKVVSAFIAGARLRAAAAEATGSPALPEETAPGAQNSAVINGYVVSGEGLILTGLDEKTAAMVLAIVAHDGGIPLEELQVKAIRSLS